MLLVAYSYCTYNTPLEFKCFGASREILEMSKKKTVLVHCRFHFTPVVQSYWEIANMILICTSCRHPADISECIHICKYFNIRRWGKVCEYPSYKAFKACWFVLTCLIFVQIQIIERETCFTKYKHISKDLHPANWKQAGMWSFIHRAIWQKPNLAWWLETDYKLQMSGDATTSLDPDHFNKPAIFISVHVWH